MDYNIKQIISEISTDFKDILLNIYQHNLDYFDSLEKYLNQQKEDFEGLAEIYPPQKHIFASFNKFNLNDLKVILIGQDPYHGPNQAMGLCFSVPDSVKLPPSLKNMYKELESDLNIKKNSGDLTDWAKQGVLLLNTALTVRQSKANSHSKIWNKFTQLILEEITKRKKDVVFLLWGNHAKNYKKYIIGSHYYLEANHPSPLSANRGGWFGCKHFSQTNDILTKLGIEKINW